MTRVIVRPWVAAAAVRSISAPIVAAIALTVFALAAGPAAASPGDYDRAYAIGLAAYTFGLPLLETDATFLTMTSINVSRGAYGPVNQFNNVSGVNNPGSTAVVAPGSNGLSSIAWLDLRAQPLVLQVPRVVDHYFVLGFIDPYTENTVNLGSASRTRPGQYVICAPGQRHVKLPRGAHRLNVDATRMWIIGSTQLKGPDDVAAVSQIQAGYTLTPLSKYGTGWKPEPPASPDTTVTTYQVPRGLQFFDRLGTLLREFPPPARDRAALRRFAEVGIGPGRRPSRDRRLSPDTLRGLQDAVTDGPQQVVADQQSIFLADFDRHNGYLLGGFGRYGTDYRLRAVVSQIGLGAFRSSQTIFATTSTDHTRQPLSGSNGYVIHLPPALPAGEGWSLTVYNLQGFLIANPMDRYQFSDTSALTRDADGSADIYLQSIEPADTARAANWLPTAAGQGFEVMWRLLAPTPGQIPGILDGSGWQPPAIEPAR